MIELIGSALGAAGRKAGVAMSVGSYSGNPVLAGLLIDKDDPVLATLGGQVSVYVDPYTQRSYNQALNLTLADGTRTGIGGRLAFETTANLFEFSALGLGSGYFNFSLRVNGLLFDTPVYSGGSNRWVSLDLSALGLGTSWRTVEIEFGNAGGFGGLMLETGAQVRAPQSIGPRIVFLGDSFTEGTGATRPGLDYPTLAGYQLGAIDVWQSAFGGTGYERTLGARPSLAQRIEQDGAAAQGDIYVIAMGINDTTDIISEVRDSLAALTAARPGAKIFVVGSWNAWSPALPGNSATVAMIRQVAAEFPQVVYLDSDRVGFTKADNTHPDDAGHQTLADWLSAQIHAAMGMDGVVDQNVAGDTVGPVFIDHFDPAQRYTYEVLEGGLASTRFELVATGDAFPILRLRTGQVVEDVGAITVDVRIISANGVVQQNPVTFSVRQRLDGAGSNDILAASHSSQGAALAGMDGNDILTGTFGEDQIDGGSGNDILQGLGGNDVLRGGAGNDIVYVETIGDIAIELPGEGDDTLHSAVPISYLLPNFERLVLEPGAISGSGSELADTLFANGAGSRLYGLAGPDRLVGGQGNDVLDGGTGADRLEGGAGDDRYVVDSAADEVIDTAGNGADQVVASASYTLAAAAEIERLEMLTVTSTASINLTGNDFAQTIGGNDGANVLRGEAGADTLYGGGGNDVLVGGTGADAMYGGTGNDTFYVDQADDRIFEEVGQGFDRVAPSIDYALPEVAEVELLEAITLSGTAPLQLGGSDHANTIYGNAGSNVLRGLGGNDTLHALAGNDALDGGAGADAMFGGRGDDTYYVDDPGDRIWEYAGEGYDRVAAIISFTLPEDAEVELVEAVNLASTVRMDMTGSSSANILSGNAGTNLLHGQGGNDTLYGFGGDDFLAGDAGADTLVGGTGNDTYYIDSGADVVVELAGEGTADRVAASASFTLSASAEIELLEALDSAGTAPLALTGSDSGNTLVGNAGANVLDGRGGADRLIGGGGADQFRFSSALGSGNVDVIADFQQGVDRIALDHAVFAVFAPGALAAASLASGASQRLFYDAASGSLAYDPDGAGGTAATPFAQLAAGLSLTSADFIIV